MVYITEAHPSDVWQMQSNIKDAVVFTSPKNEEERAFIAGACVRKLAIEFPALLDEFGNSTEQAYTGWPDRIYLIDLHGRVAYKSPPGPFGFKPEQLGIALAQTVSRTAGGLDTQSRRGSHASNLACSSSAFLQPAAAPSYPFHVCSTNLKTYRSGAIGVVRSEIELETDVHGGTMRGVKPHGGALWVRPPWGVRPQTYRG